MNFLTFDEVSNHVRGHKTGGKQYKICQKTKVEQIPADIGSEITIDQVLAVGGRPSSLVLHWSKVQRYWLLLWHTVVTIR